MKKYLELFNEEFPSNIDEKRAVENKPYVAYSIKTGQVVYTIIPKDGMYTAYRVVKKDISNCTYEMVDLGLSVKWADRNVGASSPEDYGSYFQWGDTNAYTFDGVGEITATQMVDILQLIVGNQLEVTKDNVGAILEMLGIEDLTNTPFGGIGASIDKVFNWNSYFDTTDGGSTFNKYNNEGGLTVLELSDDAAYTNMGPNYRTPTRAQIQELISNTIHTFIDLQGNEFNQEDIQNDVVKISNLKGVRLTSSNGNSIFLPAAGNCTESMMVSMQILGLYLFSSLYEHDPDACMQLEFDRGGWLGENTRWRCYGLPVRGVEFK